MRWTEYPTVHPSHHSPRAAQRQYALWLLALFALSILAFSPPLIAHRSPADRPLTNAVIRGEHIMTEEQP